MTGVQTCALPILDKKASTEEIKKAFRKIARDNHPDANPGDKAAEARFKEASEANTILSNPEKRKEYDEARSLFGGAGVRFGRSGSGEGQHWFRGSVPQRGRGTGRLRRPVRQPLRRRVERVAAQLLAGTASRRRHRGRGETGLRVGG